MKKIHFKIDPPLNWLKTISINVPSYFENQTLYFKPEFGKGTLRTLEIQTGLHITFIDLNVKEDVLMIRDSKSINDGFVMNFYFSEPHFPANLEGKEVKLGFKDQSILMASSAAEAHYQILKDSDVKLLHLYFTKDWFYNHVSNIQPYLKEAIDNNEPITIFEQLDFHFQQLRLLESQKNKLILVSELYSALSYFFDKIYKRSEIHAANINSQDLTQLMKCRILIEQNIPHVKKNEELAQIANMSLSKFKALFKKVFGHSPYKYHLMYKMEKAKELLLSTDYSVTEVGRMMGYSNLGQFSKGFYKHHSVLPKAYKKVSQIL